jgi:hypothetical protein
MKRTTNHMVMNACPRCGGAAYLEDRDENEWRCLQCARSVPAHEVEARRQAAQRTAA